MSQYGMGQFIVTSKDGNASAGGGPSATGVPSDIFTLRLSAGFALVVAGRLPGLFRGRINQGLIPPGGRDAEGRAPVAPDSAREGALITGAPPGTRTPSQFCGDRSGQLNGLSCGSLSSVATVDTPFWRQLSWICRSGSCETPVTSPPRGVIPVAWAPPCRADAGASNSLII